MDLYIWVTCTIKIFLQLFKINPWECSYTLAEYIGKYCHPPRCATFTNFPTDTFRFAVFFRFFSFFFRVAPRKAVKEAYLDPSDGEKYGYVAFPRRCPDKPSRVVSTFQARDVIPILGRCVCQSKHFRNFVRCAFNYPWSWSVCEDERPRILIRCTASRVERFNAPLMGVKLYIYIWGRVRVWMFNWTISKSKILRKYIYMYLWKLKCIF